MTPAPLPPADRSTAGFNGFLSGLVVGILSALFVSAVGGVMGFRYLKQRAIKGWNLVPVVVAAVDIDEGTVVTMEMISQRSIPEQFVTSSVVKPDSASYVVNQPTSAALQAGDPLLWSQFTAKNQEGVLVAARDLPVGAKVGEGDVVTERRPTSQLTASFVRELERSQLVGKVVVAPFLKDDPILKTHFTWP